MRVALGIDTLIENDHASGILELLIHMYPNADIFTLCHRPGIFNAPIENCKIFSTFLSPIVNSKFDYYHRTSLIPSACKTLKISEDYDLFISLSSGFAHCFNCSPKVRHVSYIFEFSKFFSFKRNLWQRMFFPYLRSFQRKKLKSVSEVVYSSESLMKAIHKEADRTKVIAPVFKIDDFPFVKDDEHPYVFDHYVAVANGVDSNLFKQLLEVFAENKLELKIVGADEEFESFKKYENLDFLGDHCNGPVSFNTHFARALIDLTDYEFPANALGGLCNGRPVVVLDNSINKEFVSSDFAYFVKPTKASLRDAVNELEEKHSKHDRKALRRNALKYNGRIFKTKMHKVLKTHN